MRPARVLLFVGAHPDDESLGPGGTLARYAGAGVRVVYACATRGEAGHTGLGPPLGPGELGERRWAELLCAARALGLAEVAYLGFRDSGMAGSPDNGHPEALAGAPLEVVAGKVVEVIRRVRPQVVVTFDPIGGYGHPDHIAIHRATLRAFHAAGDGGQFLECGPPHAPRKLYCFLFPRDRLRRVRRILGALASVSRPPAGRTSGPWESAGRAEFPVHARIRIGATAAAGQWRASACHGSQVGPGSVAGRVRHWARWVVKGSEQYMRLHPVASALPVEPDLFAGLD